MQAFGTFVPDDGDYIMPIASADRGSLHLEARYNYEELHTGSAWVGWTFGGGEKVEWEVTPMAGAIFGDLDGFGAGWEMSLNWRKLEFYSESEFVWDSSGHDGNFFYNWSELTVAPTDKFRLGLVAQRTRIPHFGRDLTPGLLAGGTIGKAELGAYAFDTEGGPTYMVSIALDF